MGDLLNSINDPRDLKAIKQKDLPVLAGEIRDMIVDVVSQTGGHIASSLGAVEIATALHYLLDAPKDKIVWDVGHQAYAHKILTGRRDSFRTLRQLGGISGFPNKNESPYDAFILEEDGSIILLTSYTQDIQRGDTYTLEQQFQLAELFTILGFHDQNPGNINMKDGQLFILDSEQLTREPLQILTAGPMARLQGWPFLTPEALQDANLYLQYAQRWLQQTY